MARFIEIALDKTFTTTKTCNSLTNCRCVELWNLFKCASHLKATSTATEGGFNGHRQAMFFCKGDNFLCGFNWIL